MGKYTDQLNCLRKRRYFMENIYHQQMALFGRQMDEIYRNYNEQTHEHDLQRIDREIAQVERLADQERIDEITAGVLSNLSKDGSKAVKDIANELQKALQSIKL